MSKFGLHGKQREDETEGNNEKKKRKEIRPEKGPASAVSNKEESSKLDKLRDDREGLYLVEVWDK
jgi:hypothetical protein